MTLITLPFIHTSTSLIMKIPRVLQLSFAVVSGLLCLIKPALAESLKPGSYWGGGSRYITIAQKGDRLCYQGASSNGVITASILVKPGQPKRYEIYQLGLSIIPMSGQSLRFGSLEYRLESLTVSSKDLQKCLNSNQPFFDQS